MKDILTQLHGGGSLTAAQAEEVFARMMAGEMDGAQVGALLALLAVREPTVEELVGVARVMRARMVRIPVPEPGDGVIDTCSTGGLGSRFFNVGTTVALVAAACGVGVCKHGNRGVTSRSGSSDVLAELGVNIEAAVEVQARCLREAGICFAYAPRHHPAMKHVAGIRQALGFATIFNLVGPLTNPAGARRQLLGTKSARLADKLLAVLVELGAERVMVVHGRMEDGGPGGVGVCDLSIGGSTYVAEYDGSRVRTYEITPEEAGLKRHGSEELEIGSAAESAEVVRGVLAGKRERHGGPREMVLLNAAGALWVGGKVERLKEGVAMAAEAIDSGAARGVLEKLVAVSGGIEHEDH